MLGIFTFRILECKLRNNFIVGLLENQSKIERGEDAVIFIL